MARRRKHNELSVSLFPFLSVLSCVIGTLTLMIAAIAVGRVAEDLEELPPLDESVPEALVAPEEVALFAAKLAEAEREHEELEALRSELRALGFDPEAEERDDAVANALELARLRERVGELARASHDLDDALEDLRKQSSYRAKRAEQAPITIQPRGEGTGLIPFFVECAEEGLRIHRQGRAESVLLRIDDLAEASRFQAFLRRVRVTRGGTVIFLIRPDGVANYRSALQQVEKLTMRHGKLPLPGQGELDFSLF